MRNSKKNLQKLETRVAVLEAHVSSLLSERIETGAAWRIPALAADVAALEDALMSRRLRWRLQWPIVRR